MTRIAAVGDLHVGLECGERVATALQSVDERADLLLLAGDLTRCGDPAEVRTLADILDPLDLPIVAVLGNHDLHAERVDELVEILDGAGVEVLQGAATTLAVNGTTVGVAGTKGFGGGFAGACISEFGEPVTKASARCVATEAERLASALKLVADSDDRVALLHYSPIRDTLRGENPEVYPYLGSHLLGEAIDRVGADLVLHGHAHLGTERGLTPGGILVRNVAQPVLDTAYRIFELAGRGEAEPSASSRTAPTAVEGR